MVYGLFTGDDARYLCGITELLSFVTSRISLGCFETTCFVQSAGMKYDALRHTVNMKLTLCSPTPQIVTLCHTGLTYTVFTRTWLRYVRVFAVANPSVCRLSVCRLSVCNVGAPYSGGWTFRQTVFTAVYAGHPLTSVQNFTDIVLGEPLRRER